MNTRSKGHKTTIKSAVKRKTKLWAGCDVAKDTFDVALWEMRESEDQRDMKEIPVETFERTEDGVRELLAWADEAIEGCGDSCRVVMEATGKYSTELAMWMLAERSSLAPAIINPEIACRFIQSLGNRNKTDRTAALGLARCGAERRPVAYEPPSAELAELAELRDLSRYRQSVIQIRVAEENRARESTASPAVSRLLKRRIARFIKDEKDIEKEMAKVLEKSSDLEKDAKLLQTVYGVGFITATSILTELGDLRRFATGRQMTAFAGVCPRNETSGTSVHKRTRMSKKGSSRVRNALYMAAMTAIGTDSELAATYRRLLDKKKTKMAALGAIMRKILILMRAILISGKPYEKHYRKAVHNFSITTGKDLRLRPFSP